MTNSVQFDASNLDWAKVDGLMPVIVQHVFTGVVLMQGFVNEEALQQTLACGHVTFFSRTKQRLWTKGESSGHFLQLRAITTDCDNDCLLIAAEQRARRDRVCCGSLDADERRDGFTGGGRAENRVGQNELDSGHSAADRGETVCRRDDVCGARRFPGGVPTVCLHRKRHDEFWHGVLLVTGGSLICWISTNWQQIKERIFPVA